MLFSFFMDHSSQDTDLKRNPLGSIVVQHGPHRQGSTSSLANRIPLHIRSLCLTSDLLRREPPSQNIIISTVHRHEYV